MLTIEKQNLEQLNMCELINNNLIIINFDFVQLSLHLKQWEEFTGKIVEIENTNEEIELILNDNNHIKLIITKDVISELDISDMKKISIIKTDKDYRINFN